MTRKTFRNYQANRKFQKEHGSIIEIIDKNTELIKANNKPKTIKRKI